MKKSSNLVQGELQDLEFLKGIEDKPGCLSALNCCDGRAQYNLQVVKKNPRIWILTLVTFFIICSSAVSLIVYIASDQADDQAVEALSLATETARWFSDELDRAILPLFSLAQFVSEIDAFYDLADSVGPSGEPGSTTLLPGAPFRDVQGVCDNPEVLDRFNQVAKTIKDNADMNGVLVSLQLVPYEVVCMIYPLVNTEDFEDGVMMNNTGAIGLDLLSDPNRISYAESVVQSDDIYVAGPLTLRECQLDGGDCVPTVEQAFIAALPITSNNHTIVIDDEELPVWGSVEALINWEALIGRSDIFERFESQGKAFRLTRRDIIVDPETSEERTEVVILAQTADFDSSKYDSQVSTTLDTTDDLWEMTIVYKSTSSWLPWVVAVTVLVVSILSMLVFCVMLEKQKLGNMKTRYREDLAQPQKLRVRLFVEEQNNQSGPSPELEDQILNKKPIADFYPFTTVMFVDLVGFASWSSQRDPSEVFKLLQTVFFTFDKLARWYGVFKVETLGDRYMTVTGLPDPQEDHAIRMVKYASECSRRFGLLTKKLSTVLGPETIDLQLRIGMASGPVTAGILLGEKSRFHLTGPTVKLANIMETTCLPGDIQIAESTAQCLVDAGKKTWSTVREDMVHDKHMGPIKSHYIKMRQRRDRDRSLTSSFPGDLESQGSVDFWEEDPELQIVDGANKLNTLIEWQVTLLLQELKVIKAARGKRSDSDREFKLLSRGETVLDEVKEVIMLPEFDPKRSRNQKDIDSVSLGPAIEAQVRSLVQQIASMYHENSFHNFEHACHVTMAAKKLLDRITVPEEVEYERRASHDVAADQHTFTFGIASDPVTHFAIIYSALIHDVDHRGIGNGQLAKEKPRLAEKYRNKSIAEQNSVDLGWDILMQPEFEELQRCIFVSSSDFERVRNLIVNSVLATDIFDPELKALRNVRWERAFHELELSLETTTEPDSSQSSHSSQAMRMSGSRKPTKVKELKQLSTNRKATIVIEHIIQAADVSHTMQHWNIYKKWNKMLFKEMYKAWKEGRLPNNPAVSWSKGEVWFFNNYVIPLATKLEDCGVFGVASDECLFHARENRRMWELEGDRLVREMAEECLLEFKSENPLPSAVSETSAESLGDSQQSQ